MQRQPSPFLVVYPPPISPTQSFDLRVLLRNLQQQLLKVKLGVRGVGNNCSMSLELLILSRTADVLQLASRGKVMPQHTIILGSGSRVLLLGIFQLGLIYQLLLLLVLVVLVVGALGGGDAALVRETVEDTDGEGGPSEDLFPCQFPAQTSTKQLSSHRMGHIFKLSSNWRRLLRGCGKVTYVNSCRSHCAGVLEDAGRRKVLFVKGL